MAPAPFGFCDTDVIFYVYVYVLPLLSSKHKNQRILTILIICYTSTLCDESVIRQIMTHMS